MEIKVISIYLFILLQVGNFCFAQDIDILNLEEISIDSSSLLDARYTLKNFGKVKGEKSWVEDYEDYSRKFTEYSYDSIVMLFFTNNAGNQFTNWIKVLGHNHRIIINGTVFQVNDSISILKEPYPNVYTSYVNYVSKNKNIKEIIYFGSPILIISRLNKSQSYIGSLKFGIEKGVIKEILIDLRTEGDFD